MRRKPATALAVAAVSLATGPAAASARSDNSGLLATSASASTSTQARSVRRLIDRIRVSYGLRRLRANRRLARAAGAHSADMRVHGYFGHDGPDGTPGGRIRAAGYRAAALGETIAWGSGTLSTPRALVDGWMHSPPHRSIILSPRFREIGVGVARTGGQAWATADFGARR